jgi:hypothetical protein
MHRMRTVKAGRGYGWLLGVASGALAFVGLTGTASAVDIGADDEVRYVQRDLVMPELTLTPFADMRVVNYDYGFFSATHYTQSLGAKFVPVENLEISFNPGSFYAGDSSGYGAVKLGGTYQFLKKDAIQMGVSAYLPLGQTGAIDFIGIGAGLPIRIHGGDFFRLDTGLYFAGFFDSSFGNQAQFSLSEVDDTMWYNADPMIPAEFSFQIIDELFAGVDTGFGILTVDNAEDTVFVPLGFRFGGTIPVDGKPFVDLTTGFRWPAFLTTIGDDASEPGFFEVQIVRAEFHIDMN